MRHLHILTRLVPWEFPLQVQVQSNQSVVLYNYGVPHHGRMSSSIPQIHEGFSFSPVIKTIRAPFTETLAGVKVVSKFTPC